MIQKDFEISINLLVQTWLVPSLGTAAFAENRVKFDEALKVALVEKLRLTNNNAIPLANTNLIQIENESTLILCKTINTNYVYYPCKEHTPLQERINSIKIENDIATLSRWMTDLHNKNIENAFVVFVVFPCTHNDREWIMYFNLIKDLIPQNLNHIDFRFSNNAPGVLYFAKIKVTDHELEKFAEYNYRIMGFDFPKNENHFINSNTKRSRIPLKTNTYFNVLKEIQSDFLNSKKIILVEELMQLFEKRIRDILKEENPNASENQIDQWIKIFDSKGTGAKKAQILLNTVNEKNRIHYRPKLEINSQFNLFVYDELEPEKIKFPNRKIKAFDVNDYSNYNQFIYYSSEDKVPQKILIKDTELIK